MGKYSASAARVSSRRLTGHAARCFSGTTACKSAWGSPSTGMAARTRSTSRAGLDHLAFAVADREELDAWAARLTDAAVVHSPVTAANSVPGAAVLVFRDPDNIQLELFASHRHRQLATGTPGRP